MALMTKPKAGPFALAEDEDDLSDLYAKPKETVAAKPPPKPATFTEPTPAQKDPRAQYRNTYTGVDPYSIDYESGLDPTVGRGQAVYDDKGNYIGYQDPDAKHAGWVRGEDGRVYQGVGNINGTDARGVSNKVIADQLIKQGKKVFIGVDGTMYIDSGGAGAQESMGASKAVREREELRGQAIASKIGAAPGTLQRRSDGWYENGVKVADTAGNLTAEGAKYATAPAAREPGKSPFLTMADQARKDVTQAKTERQQEFDEYQDFLTKYAELEFDPQFRDSMIRAEQQEQQLRERLLAFDPKAQAQADSDRALREQLSVAGATRGGLGAQLAARDRAQSLAPQLQQNALDAALQREQANLTQVGQSLGRSANIAATGWQQDDARANAKAQVGLTIGSQLGQMMGIDWQLDSKEAMALSDFAAELVRLEQSGQALDNQMALGRLQATMQKYGIDLQNSANMKSLYAQMEAQKIGWDDIGMLALSAGGQIGASYAGKK